MTTVAVLSSTDDKKISEENERTGSIISKGTRIRRVIMAICDTQ